MKWIALVLLAVLGAGCTEEKDLYDHTQDARVGEYCIEEQTIAGQSVLKHYYYNIRQTCSDEKTHKVLSEDQLLGCFAWNNRGTDLAMVKGTENVKDTTCALPGNVTLKQIDSQTTQAIYPDGSTSALQCFPVASVNRINGLSCAPVSYDQVYLSRQYFDEKLIGGCHREQTKTCTDYFGNLDIKTLSGSCTGLDISCLEFNFGSIKTGCPKQTEYGFAIEWLYDDSSCPGLASPP